MKHLITKRELKMTKYLQAVEGHDMPANKQARELLEYVIKKAGYKKFPKSDFIKHLKTQEGKNTALKDSKANPALTFNYYLSGLLNYGHMNQYEDDTLLAPKMGKIDPFNRKKVTGAKKSAKKLTLAEQKTSLEAIIAESTEALAEVNKRIANGETDEVPAVAEGSNFFDDDEAGEELTDEEMEAATAPEDTDEAEEI